MSPRAQRFTTAILSPPPPMVCFASGSARRSSIFLVKVPSTFMPHLAVRPPVSPPAGSYFLLQQPLRWISSSLKRTFARQAISQPLGRLQPSVQESWKFALNEAPFNSLTRARQTSFPRDL